MKFFLATLALAAAAFLLALHLFLRRRVTFVYPSPLRERLVCLTTTPARLRNEETLLKRLEQLVRVGGHDGVVLSVPWVYARTSEPYVVPESLFRIQGLRVHRCQDEGPGTKVLAPLRSREISSAAILMFCDDDTSYGPYNFEALSHAVDREPEKVHSLCVSDVRGFLGFGGIKSTLLPLLEVPVPASCFSVDDVFFTHALASLGIDIERVDLPGAVACGLGALNGLQGALASVADHRADASGLYHREVLASNRRRDATLQCVEALARPTSTTSPDDLAGKMV